MKYRDFIRGGPTPGEAGEAMIAARALDGQMIEFSGFSIVYDDEGKVCGVFLQEKS